MGIDHLTADILADAKREAKEIVDAALAEKKKALGREKKAVSGTILASEKEAEEFVASQKRERIAWAKLEAKKIVGDAREAMVRQAMDGLYKKLASFSGTKEYGDFLNARVKQALAELGLPKAVVHLCKGEKKYLKGVNAAVKEDLTGMGGAIVESPDGSVRVDFTLETLFEERMELLRKAAYEKMFG